MSSDSERVPQPAGEHITPASLVPIQRPKLVPNFDTRKLIAAFLAGRNAQTMRAYARDLQDFMIFMKATSPEDAARLLLGGGHGEANALALAFKAELIERGLSANTVNRRLAAVRSLVKLARTLGMIPWTLEVGNVKAEPYRDTKGPGTAGVRLILEELGRRRDPKGIRDRCIVRLLFDLGLRRAEVVSLDTGDVDLEAGNVAVLGKGRSAKVKLTLPPETSAALREWMDVRGADPGPLFTNFDRAGKGRRLTATSLYRMVMRLGEAAGVRVRPHGIRHAAITEALDRTRDVRAVQRFSRHRDMRILTVYDDNREDLGGKVARTVAAAV